MGFRCAYGPPVLGGSHTLANLAEPLGARHGLSASGGVQITMLWLLARALELAAWAYSEATATARLCPWTRWGTKWLLQINSEETLSRCCAQCIGPHVMLYLLCSTRMGRLRIVRVKYITFNKLQCKIVGAWSLVSITRKVSKKWQACFVCILFNFAFESHAVCPKQVSNKASLAFFICNIFPCGW